MVKKIVVDEKKNKGKKKKMMVKTIVKENKRPKFKPRSAFMNNKHLDINPFQEAKEAAFATLAPRTASQHEIIPGVPTGQLSQSYRQWITTTFDVNATTPDAKDGSYYMRVNVTDSLAQQSYTYTGWGTAVAGTPTTGTFIAASDYASLTGAGALYYRTVSLGLDVYNTTTELSKGGSYVLTQQPSTKCDATISYTSASNLVPHKIGSLDITPPISGIWLPNPAQNVMHSFSDAPSDLRADVLCFQAHANEGFTVRMVVTTLVEILGTGSALMRMPPSIGDTSTYAAAIANSLDREPQFSAARVEPNTKAGTALANGFDQALLGSKARKGLVNLVGKGFDWLDGAASSVINSISGIFDAVYPEVDPFKLQASGYVVGNGLPMATAIVQLTGSDMTPEAFLALCESILQPTAVGTHVHRGQPFVKYEYHPASLKAPPTLVVEESKEEWVDTHSTSADRRPSAPSSARSSKK